ncbi:MAG: PEP-CTERM sorting domain-containing protein [Pseudomonadales bacterium]|nr:PEP-CTERM sorting domain-containing protein [Pseudomonadales bacterium]
MLKMKKAMQVAALSLVSVTPMAQAIILEGSFTGTIYNSYDRFNEFGEGVGNNTVVGETVTGTFTIDTDLMPSDRDNRPNNTNHIENGVDDWFTFELETSFGHSWSSDAINQNTGATRDWDQAYIENDYASYSRDRILLREYAYDNVGDRNYDTFYLQVLSDNGTHLNGDDFLDDAVLPESFDMAGTDFGLARGYVRNYTYENSQIHEDFTYIWNLNTLEWAPAEVPEPSSIAMFGLGLIGLGFARRRVNAQQI